MWGQCLLPALSNQSPGILVRNEAAREELRAQVGEIGLIL